MLSTPTISFAILNLILIGSESVQDYHAVSQVSANYFTGKGISNTDQFASIQGGIAAAHYIRSIAPSHGVRVVLHTDHCAKKLPLWLDGLLDVDEKYFADHGEPLFTLHMIDLSEEEKDWNIATMWKYLERVAPMKKLGLLAGEDGGVNNTGVNNSALYTQPEEISVYTALSPSPPTSQLRRASEISMWYTIPAMLIDATNILFIGVGEAYKFSGLVHLLTHRNNTLATL
ncbi:Fructose-bisphosphate aldolase 1 [Rhizina undulata]